MRDDFEQHLDPNDPTVGATAYLGGVAIAEAFGTWLEEHVGPAVELARRYGQDPRQVTAPVAQLLREAASALDGGEP